MISVNDSPLEKTPKNYLATKIKIHQDIVKGNSFDDHETNIALKNYNRFVEQVLNGRRDTSETNEIVKQILNDLDIEL